MTNKNEHSCCDSCAAKTDTTAILHSHEHEPETSNEKPKYIRIIVGVIIFAVTIGITKFVDDSVLWRDSFSVFPYLTAYLLIGWEILLTSAKNISSGDFFDENFLMTIATIGAFAIGEYPESVAVMLFYQIGMFFEDLAVGKSRKSIAQLMDIRPDYANLKNGSDSIRVAPESIKIDDLILVKPGERIPLDGIIVEGDSVIDNSALTGESAPCNVHSGDNVLSGSINKSGVLTVKVSKIYAESTVSKILNLVENASQNKSKTQNYITKFAKVYTPAVVLVAALLAFVPPILITDANFTDWIHRALIFLVMSCPCALVISIPLSFFGGIGGASKQGILIKGANYLEALSHADTFVFDKTGTLTKGVFEVNQVFVESGFTKESLLEFAAYTEIYSSHPIALSIQKAYGKVVDKSKISQYQEYAGFGISANVNGKHILAGNAKLFDKFSIKINENNAIGTVVYISVDNAFAGGLVVCDEIKADSQKTIKSLQNMSGNRIIMLTGDRKSIGEQTAKELGISEYHTNLLPDQKVEKVEEIKRNKKTKGSLVFVGDGINDAPVLAGSDIGIAMGGLGSDAAIEAADIVLMSDEPYKIITAIKIAKKTKSIVWQNIILALGIKGCVLVLGALGQASMWQAVFADVGVTFIAVLNSIRAIRI